MTEELSAKQLQAAILIVGGASITATAAQTGLTRVTLHQWLKSDDLFIAHLNGLKQDLINAGRAGLQASVALAISTINALMTGSENDMVRLNAAKEVLNRAGINNALVIGSDNAAQLKKDRDFNETLSFY
ncbi:MAG: phBC6A51 family helix-turn-helix protein [Methylococcaceae bacterium]